MAQGEWSLSENNTPVSVTLAVISLSRDHYTGDGKIIRLLTS